MLKNSKRNGIPSYTIDDIVHGFSEDLRSFYETFHKYGTILCSDIHEKGNVVLQDLIDHLGPNKTYYRKHISLANPSTEQIIMKESPYIVSDSSYNIGSNLSSDNTRVSIDNMKYYIMSGFYSVDEIKNQSNYRNLANTSDEAFVTSDFYTFAFQTAFRYYTPDLLRNVYTLDAIINQSGFTLQDLYDYNFNAIELKNVRQEQEDQ